MAGQLATPVLDDLQVLDVVTGSLNVDVNWVGQPNHVDLEQIRTRWIARTNAASQPAPVHGTAGAWAESSTLATQGDFRYIDTIENAGSPQMSTSGAQSEENEAIINGFFGNKTVWAMSRLEVV